MNEKSKAAMRAYQKAWRRSHPEKIRAYNERYWQKKAEQLEKTCNQNEKEEKDE